MLKSGFVALSTSSAPHLLFSKLSAGHCSGCWAHWRPVQGLPPPYVVQWNTNGKSLPLAVSEHCWGECWCLGRGQEAFSVQLHLADDGFEPSLAGGISGEATLQGDFFLRSVFHWHDKLKGEWGNSIHPHPYCKGSSSEYINVCTLINVPVCLQWKTAPSLSWMLDKSLHKAKYALQTCANSPSFKMRKALFTPLTTTTTSL